MNIREKIKVGISELFKRTSDPEDKHQLSVLLQRIDDMSEPELYALDNDLRKATNIQDAVYTEPSNGNFKTAGFNAGFTNGFSQSGFAEMPDVFETGGSIIQKRILRQRKTDYPLEITSFEITNDPVKGRIMSEKHIIKIDCIHISRRPMLRCKCGCFTCGDSECSLKCSKCKFQFCMNHIPWINADDETGRVKNALCAKHNTFWRRIKYR